MVSMAYGRAPGATTREAWPAPRTEDPEDRRGAEVGWWSQSSKPRAVPCTWLFPHLPMIWPISFISFIRSYRQSSTLIHSYPQLTTVNHSYPQLTIVNHSYPWLVSQFHLISSTWILQQALRRALEQQRQWKCYLCGPCRKRRRPAVQRGSHQKKTFTEINWHKSTYAFMAIFRRIWLFFWGGLTIIKHCRKEDKDHRPTSCGKPPRKTRAYPRCNRLTLAGKSIGNTIFIGI